MITGTWYLVNCGVNNERLGVIEARHSLQSPATKRLMWRYSYTAHVSQPLPLSVANGIKSPYGA